MRVIVLTGERGVGKSIVCRETIALAQARRHTCGGLLTLRRPDGTLDVLDVHSGYVRRLTLEPDESPVVTQGRFRFNPATLAWGNDALARTTACHLLVLDELGPLEMEQGQGWQRAFEVLHKSAFTLALVVVRPEMLVQAQLRLPTSATTVLTVTPHNRNSLPAALLKMLERETGSVRRET